MARAKALADALQPLAATADQNNNSQPSTQPAIDVSLWLELALVDLTPEEQHLVGSFH